MSRQEKDNTLKISGKTFVFKESDIKLFRNLENAISLNAPYGAPCFLTGGACLSWQPG